MSEVDYKDVQGLLRYGYGRMTSASYALVRVQNVAAARSWLGSAPVTSAVEQMPPPKTALNVAFTAPGLRAVGVPAAVIEGFSHEFRGGMSEQSRARQLGDVGSNAPARWDWGAPGREPHAVVMFFAEPDHFGAFVQSLTGNLWSEAFGDPYWLETTDQGGHEPFGFKDGINQPRIDWEQARDPTSAAVEYTNWSALGEFLLGYRNEYGKFTDRPLLVADASSAGLLFAEDDPTKKDLGRNGTYLVLRQLEQDVRGFWQFAHRQAGGELTEAEKLASKMVGRTQSGDPLVPKQEKLIPGVEMGSEQNSFTFDQDASGGRCPFGAHIRRVNPRDADYPEQVANPLEKLVTMLGFGPRGFRDDLLSSVRFHRLVRRGREYGPKLLPEAALAPAQPDERKRGLHFVGLNANLSRQFEFLQNAWIANTQFSGLTGESDPLLGNRGPLPCDPVTDHFTIPGEGGLRRRLSGLPQFVTVRGGAYFFLPSLGALRYLAGFTDR